MYSKERINQTYVAYVTSREEQDLAALLKELEPVVDVILSRWVSFHEHHQDARQECFLRLWRNLQRRETASLEKQAVNPTAYLYFLIRSYLCKIFNTIRTLSTDSDSLLEIEDLL